MSKDSIYAAPAAQAERPEPPPVEQAITTLVDALARSKGWMRDYADAVVRDAIDRKMAEPVALPVMVRPEKVGATMKEMRAAYIDVTIHSQSAYAVCDYIEVLESALSAKGQS